MIHATFASAGPFVGRINVTHARFGEPENFIYIFGTNDIRIQRVETNRPYPVNLINRDSGATTLLFPNNRSFIQLKLNAGNNSTPLRVPSLPADAPVSVPAVPASFGPTNLPGIPAAPSLPGGLPSGVGPQSGSSSISEPFAMPQMPAPPPEVVELQATTNTRTILGFLCVRYDIRQRDGQTMEIWATDKLEAPFPSYVEFQPPRDGSRILKDRWGGLLKAKRLFPMRAILRFENGPEQMRFEVKTVTVEPVGDVEGKLFQPPPDYSRIEPLPY